MSNGNPYRRPPVVEAVIDLQFVDQIQARELERLRDRFKKKYPSVLERSDFQFVVGSNSPPTYRISGYQMTSEDGKGVLILQERGITTSVLAPYQNWENLIATAKANFDTLLKVTERPKLKRVATKFVNRIDVSYGRLLEKRWDEFVNIGPALPQGLANGIAGFNLAIQFALANSAAKAIVNAIVLPPFLVGYLSLQLDIDVYYEEGIPLRFDEMWKLVDGLREAKNRIFEASITDNLREVIR
jgi:uncharacterized protein (TIGR04255 family)